MSYQRVAFGAAVTKGAVPLIPTGPRSITRDDALIAMSRMPVSGHWGGTGDQAREMVRALQDLPIGAPVPREWVLTIRRRFNPNILKSNGLEGLGAYQVPRRHLRLVRGLGGLGLTDQEVAARARIPTDVLRAIRSAESGGHANVVRFEPRIFNGLTHNQYASQFPTSTGSPGTGTSLPAAFHRAYLLDPRNAVNATSWGMYQVLLRDAGPQIWTDAGNDPARFVAMFAADPQSVSDQILVSWFNHRPRAVAAAQVPNFVELSLLYNGSSTSPWGARVAAAYARLGGSNAVPALVQASVAAALPWVAGISALTIGSLYAIWWWDKHAPKHRAA